MRECHRCIHYPPDPSLAWEDSPCSHCTATYAEQKRSHRQRRQVIAPAATPAPSPDEYLARKTVLAWTHISRTYPAAAAYILAKLADQSLSYAAIGRRFKVSKTTVQYQISLAIMAEPDLAALLTIDRSRTKRKGRPAR